MWKEPQLESRRWVRCQSRAFFASARGIQFPPGRARLVPGQRVQPRERFPHARGAFHLDRAGPRTQRSDSATRASSVHLHLLGNVRDLSETTGFVGREMPRKCGRERNSLIRAEISLIARFNSLQGSKKFPVRMRRELSRKTLSWHLFLLALTRRRAPNRWNSLYFPC